MDARTGGGHDEMLRMIERAIEKALFASRWLLAPFFIALALGLAVLLVKMGQAFYEFALHAWGGSESDAILGILGLIDLTLTGSLIVIVIFSGYEISSPGSMPPNMRTGRNGWPRSILPASN
jgi:uncharacterized protein UPF0114